MKFSLCTGIDAPMKTLLENWKLWIPKVIQKAKVEVCSSRSVLFQYSIVAELAEKTPEELIECKCILLACTNYNLITYYRPCCIFHAGKNDEQKIKDIRVTDIDFGGAV